MISMDITRTDAPEKPGTQIRGKKFWMVTGILVSIVIIIVILAFIMFQAPGNNESTLNPVATNSFPQFQVTTISLHEGSPGIRSPDTYVTETPKAPVDFVLQSGEPANCGLTCRAAGRNDYEYRICDRPQCLHHRRPS